jgi:hypothetical protein
MISLVISSSSKRKCRGGSANGEWMTESSMPTSRIRSALNTENSVVRQVTSRAFRVQAEVAMAKLVSFFHCREQATLNRRGRSISSDQ